MRSKGLRFLQSVPSEAGKIQPVGIVESFFFDDFPDLARRFASQFGARRFDFHIDASTVFVQNVQHFRQRRNFLVVFQNDVLQFGVRSFVQSARRVFSHPVQFFVVENNDFSVFGQHGIQLDPPNPRLTSIAKSL